MKTTIDFEEYAELRTKLAAKEYEITVEFPRRIEAVTNALKEKLAAKDAEIAELRAEIAATAHATIGPNSNGKPKRTDC